MKSIESNFVLCMIPLLFLVLPQTGNAQTAGAIIAISDRVVVDGDHVLLGDLLMDQSALTAEQCRKKVFPAPKRGEQQRISLVDIAYRLQVFPELLDFQLRGPNIILIERRINSGRMLEVLKAVADEIKKTSPWDNWTVDVRFPATDENKLNDIDNFSSVRLQGEQNTSFLGNVPLRVTFLDADGKILAEETLTPRITREIQALMLLEPQKRDHLVVSEDLSTSPVWVNSEDISYITQKADCIGRTLNRDLGAGEILTEEYLQNPLCAERGDVVWVSCETGSLNISLSTTAMEGGRRGSTIQVKNPVSNKVLRVQLTADKKAVYHFGG